VYGKVFYKELFEDDDWHKRWVEADGSGKWVLGTSEWFGNEKVDQGIKTSQDAKFYAISSKFDKAFTNEKKDLIIQFSVKFPQKIDCGGGYIKILKAGLNQKKFDGESPYNIMFGPDICGTSTKKVHVIFNYKGENLLTKKNIRCETDQLTHVYTLIVRPDNTYEVLIDGVSKAEGSLYDDWDFLLPREIPDPDESKPADWVDVKKIPDPKAKKPKDWKDVPAKIADPHATKPDDWDDELDGEWEAPLIDNPEYKGEWKAPMIDNPAYKGEWVHPMIPNPDFVDDPFVYIQKDMAFVGVDLWQVKSGTLFSNILVTDDHEEARKLREEYYEPFKDIEKEVFEAKDNERKTKEEAERKKNEELRRKQEEDLKDLEDDDEDWDEHDEL